MAANSTGLSEFAFEPSTLVDFLRWRAAHQPDRWAYAFLVDGETEQVSLTYGELDRKARAIAARLQSLGEIGERALLLYPPGLEFIAAYLGCLYSGIIAVPAYPPHPARPDRAMPKMMAIAKDAKPLAALTTSSILAMGETLLEQAPDLRSLHWLATDEVAKDLAEKWQDPAVNGNTLAFLQYTSGSTTAPKGVMVSHGNLVYNLALIRKCFELTPNSRSVLWLPPYHDMGLIGGILEPLYLGMPMVLMSPVAFLQRPFHWLKAISDFKITVSGGPNFAYDLCVRRITPEQRATLDLSTWELAFNGAEPIHHETLERFAEYFAPCGFRREAFYPCYGLAEATLIVSGGLKAAPPVIHNFQTSALEQNKVAVAPIKNESTRTLVGCGQTLAGQKIIIVDPESLTRCPPDQVGEIWVSGPSVAQGYWNQPTETERAFRAYLADTKEGPFLRTGDFGFLMNGELFVTGRLKDLIIIDGSNHYPQDIERTVEECHPAIRPSCCAAFSIDGSGGEQLVVFAEVERGYLSKRYKGVGNGFNLRGREPTEVEALTKTIRRAVAEHHDLQVHDIRLLKPGSIPKTSSGKIQRHACRADYLGGIPDVLEE